MLRDFAPLIVATICYPIALGLRVDLDVGDVTLGAAFAPLIGFVAQHSIVSEYKVALFAASLGVLLAVVRHRPPFAVLRDLSALGVSLLVVDVIGRGLTSLGLRGSPSVAVVLVGGAAVVAYSLVADGLKHLVGRESSIAREDRRVWFLLQAVLVSAFGLMVLVYKQIGWPAMAAMLALLALTKGEFARYSQARRTLTQTMRALAELEAASLP